MTDHQPLTAFEIQDPPHAQHPGVGSKIVTGLGRVTRDASAAAHQTRALLGLDRQEHVEPPPRMSSLATRSGHETDIPHS